MRESLLELVAVELVFSGRGSEVRVQPDKDRFVRGAGGGGGSSGVWW